MAEGIIKNNDWKLVWTNPNPNNSFPTQTVSVDLRGYSWAKIFFNRDDQSSTIVGSVELPVGESVDGVIYGVSYNLLGRRGIPSVSQSGITFGSGGVYNTYSANISPNDLVFIPYKIYAR